jgi:hypothetical protein
MSAFTDPDGYRRGFNGDPRGGTSSVGYRNGALAKDSIDRTFRQGPYAPTSTPTTPFVSSGRVTPISSGSGGYYAGSRSYSSGTGFFSFLGKIIRFAFTIIGFGILALIVYAILGTSNTNTPPNNSGPAQPTVSSEAWPDGTVVHYPTKWVWAHPVKIPAADPELKLHTGPNMKTPVVVEIPAAANDIVLLTAESVPNGPTKWFRAIWAGHRGYVGGGFIEANSQ